MTTITMLAPAPILDSVSDLLPPWLRQSAGIGTFPLPATMPWYDLDASSQFRSPHGRTWSASGSRYFQEAAHVPEQVDDPEDPGWWPSVDEQWSGTRRTFTTYSQSARTSDPTVYSLTVTRSEVYDAAYGGFKLVETTTGQNPPGESLSQVLSSPTEWILYYAIWSDGYHYFPAGNAALSNEVTIAVLQGWTAERMGGEGDVATGFSCWTTESGGAWGQCYAGDVRARAPLFHSDFTPSPGFPAVDYSAWNNGKMKVEFDIVTRRNIPQVHVVYGTAQGGDSFYPFNRGESRKEFSEPIEKPFRDEFGIFAEDDPLEEVTTGISRSSEPEIPQPGWSSPAEKIGFRLVSVTGERYKLEVGYRRESWSYNPDNPWADPVVTVEEMAKTWETEEQDLVEATLWLDAYLEFPDARDKGRWTAARWKLWRQVPGPEGDPVWEEIPAYDDAGQVRPTRGDDILTTNPRRGHLMVEKVVRIGNYWGHAGFQDWTTRFRVATYTADLSIATGGDAPKAGARPTGSFVLSGTVRHNVVSGKPVTEVAAAQASINGIDLPVFRMREAYRNDIRNPGWLESGVGVVSWGYAEQVSNTLRRKDFTTAESTSGVVVALDLHGNGRLGGGSDLIGEEISRERVSLTAWPDPDDANNVWTEYATRGPLPPGQYLSVERFKVVPAVDIPPQA